MGKFVMMPMFDVPDLSGGGGGSEPDVADIISSSLEGLPGREAEGETPPTQQVTGPTAEEQKEEEELKALESEILSKNPNMRGKIDVHRHQAVLTRNRNQWTAKEKEYADAKAKYEKDIAEWKRYEWAKDPQLTEALNALALAETDQKAFVEYLLQDERFANLIDFKQQGQKPVGEQAPGPNKLSADGSYKYYDDEGLQARFEWERAQAVKLAQTELQKQQKDFEKRFDPITKEYTARNQWNAALTSQKTVLDKVREQWAGFKENEPAIKKAMIEHQDWSLDDAYRNVVMQNWQSNNTVKEAELRKKIIEEMNGKRKAAGSIKPGGGVEKESVEGEPDMADVILRSLQGVPGR